jgi:hypothetical protein
MTKEPSATPRPTSLMPRVLGRAAILLLLAACATTPGAEQGTRYGAEQAMGNGTVRTYVTLDPADQARPLEVGVAISESALDGLPAPRPMPAAAPSADGHGAGGAQDGGHAMHAEIDSHTLLLELPAGNPTPYTFVELNWNPAGHEPNGVYDEPHLDFHFWTESKALRASIVPSDAAYGTKAGTLPAEEYRMPFYLDAGTAAKAPAVAVAVPLMGMHWLDVRSPELQGLAGHPEKQQRFTTTFIYGSWDGRFVFAEPMITRAHIVAKRTAQDPAVRDEVIPVSAPARVQRPGYHPTAYRIAYDPAAREYRIALTGLERRD